MAKQTVVIIELMDFHAEIFPVYSGLLPYLLGDNLDLHYLVTPKRYQEMPDISGTFHCLEPSWQRFVAAKSGLRKHYYRQLIASWLKRLQPSTVVFNTVETGDLRFLHTVLNTAKKHLCLITVHDAHHPIYSHLAKHPRIKLFCLNHYNYELLRSRYPLDAYYTCAFPSYPNLVAKSRAADEPYNIIIPGQIDFRRRNYQHLIDIAQHHAADFQPPFYFTIYGDINSKHGIILREQVLKAQLMHYFRFIDHRPSDHALAQAIVNADFVMPILENDSYYAHGSIAGSIVHAGAYRCPMILSTSWSRHLHLSSQACISYHNIDDFYHAINTVNYTTLKQNYIATIKQYLSQNEAILAELKTKMAGH